MRERIGILTICNLIGPYRNAVAISKVRPDAEYVRIRIAWQHELWALLPERVATQ